ncbi:MAG TPA: YicC/YloC family endoribonuclease, partial [Verrucomicrobiae bacterium]|nr:YicC/YloC family endoribonuclease [Verrucomicrobiae bacterium]
ELSSVNRKQSEISISLPRDLEVLEAQIRDEVNRKLSRGRVTIRVSLHTAEGNEGARVQINKPLAQAYARELRAVAKELRLAGDLSVELLIRAPGVLDSNSKINDAEALWPSVFKALSQALGDMLKMRAREGGHLKKDLSERIGAMRKAVTRIRKEAPVVQKRYREQLIERIKTAGLQELQIDEERISKEVVFFADRSDISEELTRLQSHFQQFDDCLKSGEPIGRTLDFLAQEMNREINTIGSKANDSLISREVVQLKTELEKFREQAQNVE